jgi:hypothetical protein
MWEWFVKKYHHIVLIVKLLVIIFQIVTNSSQWSFQRHQENEEQNENRQQTHKKSWTSILAPSKVVNNNLIVLAEKVLERENVPNSVVGYSHTSVDDPLVNDIIRSKDFATNKRVDLIHEQDIFSAQVIPEQPMHVNNFSNSTNSINLSPIPISINIPTVILNLRNRKLPRHNKREIIYEK